MARSKSRFVCQECGFQSVRFLGRCTDCQSWNSLVEELVVSLPAQNRQAIGGGEGPLPLSDLNVLTNARIQTGMAGVDQVLGGGLVPGSVVLLAGDPGIGKSTLLLQLSQLMAELNPVLYITGEESAQQVKLRAQRLAIGGKQVLVDSVQNVSTIQNQIERSAAKVAIIDSIQSVYLPELTSAPGSVSQVRESTSLLSQTARQFGVAIILVGHVTKDGTIAGPRVLEHMVDVVLQFSGERSRQLRILRAAKNRYGSTQELAVFTMDEHGLSEVDSPSLIFLGNRINKLSHEKAPSGTAVIAGSDGTKALLLEVQALVGLTPFSSPRRVTNGWDYNRLLQILAVLERKAGLELSRLDVYVNIVGGLDFNDPAGDLGVSVAIATSVLDRSINPHLILIGEIGLTGEVRPVSQIERSLKEASKLGFKQALVPKGNLPIANKIDNMKVDGIEYLVEALEIAMPGQTFCPSGLSKLALNLSQPKA